jgi:two-component system CheB/CheR fusion protein
MTGTTNPHETNPPAQALPAEIPSPAVALDPQPECAFPIVGIGASAGGLAAFEALFSAMPAEPLPGMAFVLVQHLSPDHKSQLSELIQRDTRLQVVNVEDGMPVLVNCIYVIQPGYDMVLHNGVLHLLEPTAPRGQRLPVDMFFRSLALDQGARAIGIVLSGSGSDGALGVRAIREAAGMVMVQTPDSAEFDGMPRSALSAGVADFECEPAQMPAQLANYIAQAYGKRSSFADAPSLLSEAAMGKIFVLLRNHTRHDLSQYKRGTIQRRIERRMAVYQMDNADHYIRLLQEDAGEITALFQDLLIGVTQFFRDTEAFAALETKVVPELFVSKSTVNGVVRVWVAGCSTGEEAYSIAILLQERMEALQQSYVVQVFATDIDSRAIAIARSGIYPLGIAADVSPVRLSRFFSAEPGGQAYRVHKGIRDMLVFSEQDLVSDPPFSKLDLISCRNLLIYFNAELQQRLMPLFHYALNPQGKLFLGSSEGVGEFTDLFNTLDRKAKLFERGNILGGRAGREPSRFAPALSALDAALPRAGSKAAFPRKVPLREIIEQTLLTQVAPAAALVTASGDILYLYGRAGMYLEHASGEPGVANMLTMAREGLRPALSGALRECAATQAFVRKPAVRVKTQEHFTQVNLLVRPVVPSPGAAQPMYLVLLEDALEVKPSEDTEGTGVTDSPAATHMQAQITVLTDELRAKDDYLRNAHEELSGVNEELKSSNEEMQSVNEELQSTNEELETSKEELQSVNEELSTVNRELTHKMDAMEHLNNDMNNLLAGTGVATVFVDHQLRIMRFTPSTTQVINLIPSDVGRPLGHIVSNLVGYDRLLADTQAVLDSLVPIMRQVQTVRGGWFTLRIHPYRTLKNVINGAVLTFSDISEIKRMEAALAEASKLARLAVVVRDAHDAITVQDLQGQTLAWNPAAMRMYGWSEAQALAMNVQTRIPQALRQEETNRMLQLSRSAVLEPYRTQRISQSGASMDVWITSTALMDEDGQMYAISTTERNQVESVS